MDRGLETGLVVDDRRADRWFRARSSRPCPRRASPAAPRPPTSPPEARSRGLPIPTGEKIRLMPATRPRRPRATAAPSPGRSNGPPLPRSPPVPVPSPTSTASGFGPGGLEPALEKPRQPLFHDGRRPVYRKIFTSAFRPSSRAAARSWPPGPRGGSAPCRRRWAGPRWRPGPGTRALPRRDRGRPPEDIEPQEGRGRAASLAQAEVFDETASSPMPRPPPSLTSAGRPRRRPARAAASAATRRECACTASHSTQ